MGRRLRGLLWVDCTAAIVVGTAVLALSGFLAPLLGLPRGLLVVFGVVNLAYGAFSFSLARRAPAAAPRAIAALVAANSAWVVVCVVVAVHFARPGSWLGAAYALGEAVFVGLLALLERDAAR